MLTTISKEAALAHASGLIKLLKGYQPHHLLANYDDPTLTTLDQLEDILDGSKSVNPTPHISPKVINSKLPRVLKTKDVGTSKNVPKNTSAKLPRVQPSPHNTPTKEAPSNNTIHNFTHNNKVTKTHEHRCNT